MTDNVYKEILKPLNQCNLTGLETAIYSERFNDKRITIYKDNYGQYRITLKDITNNQTLSGILFDKTKTIRFKYTLPAFCGNGYTKQLFAYIEYKVKRKFYHSQNLTLAGEKSI